VQLRAVLSVAGFVALVVPAVAWAHSAGIAADDCNGCHSGGQAPTVTLTASPTNPAVGQQVTLTVTVSQTNGPGAGFFLTSDASVGTFKAIQAGTAVSAGGVMHTMPHTGSSGWTVFQAGWSASQATGVRFTVSALSANGDGTPRGDAGGEASLSMTAGCPGTDYYVDQDGDGYGTNDPAFPVARACALPSGYALVAGDCDDFDASIHPGATEVCNGKDDNCNGQIDEGLPRQFYCVDRDGDGHGVPAEGDEASCKAMPGYGDCGGDCDDSDPTQWVQLTCGVGWCRRDALGCSMLCTPGAPRVEVCNDFDDDCDGVVDNGSDLQLCGAPGLKCIAGVCVAATSNGGASGGSAPGSDGPAPGAGGSAADAGGSVNRWDAGGGAGASSSGRAGAGGSGALEQGGCSIAALARGNDSAPIAMVLVLSALARRRRCH
jgi:hypothetical protein